MSRHEKTPGAAAEFARITLGSDGRVYWHELTPELFQVASALCGEDAALQRILVASTATEGEHERHTSAS